MTKNTCCNGYPSSV